MKPKLIYYLCLQATREGQASYAHVHEIIAGLKRRGWEVELFQPKYASHNRSVGLFTKIASFFTVQLRLILSPKPDILYIRTHPAAIMAPLIAWLRHIPVIQEINGPYEDVFIAYPWLRPLSDVIIFFQRLTLRLSKAIVVVTPQLAEWIAKEVEGKPIFVIPNGANTELFHPNAALSYQVPGSYVVFFGAFARWQGIETILKAVGSDKWPNDVSLVMLGDGAERPKVEQVAAQNPKVLYLGKLPYCDVPGIIAHSIAGLSPQNNELRSRTGLFPLKVFETLACGVPVVVTDFPGQADLVRQYGCGVVIPPDDEEALANAVQYLYSHSEERREMGRRGRQIVEQEYSWDIMALMTHDVLCKYVD